MSKGSDLFYEPFKGDGGLPTKGRQESSGELMNTMTHSHMFVYKMLLSCFDHHKWQFSSSERHLNNVLSLPLITSTWEAGGVRGPLKELHRKATESQFTHHTKTIHATMVEK